MANNPVIKEVLRVRRQWEAELDASPEIRLFRWLGERIELQIVDAFLKFQMSEESYGDDVYVQFVNGFDSPEDFGRTIFEDIGLVLDDWHARLSYEEKPTLPQWHSVHSEDPFNDPDPELFTRNINRLRSFHGLKAHMRFVVCIQPAKISDLGAFCAWVERVVRSGLDPGVKLMLMDTNGLRIFDALDKSCRPYSKTIRPEVDTEGMLTRSLEAASPKGSAPEPAHEFQKWLLNASFLLGKGKTGEAIRCTDNCLAIAQTHGFADLRSVAHVFRATVHLSGKDPKEALREIELGIRYASANKQQELQARMFKGSILVSQKETKRALEAFRDCLPLIGAEDHGWSIEVNRLIGDCARQLGQRGEASDAYLRCVTSGESLPTSEAKASTLPLAAEGLLRIAVKDIPALETRVEHLLGPGWRALAGRLRSAGPIDQPPVPMEEPC